MAFYIHHDARSDYRKFDENDLSMKTADIKRAMHHEKDSQALMEKLDRGEKLSGEEKRLYQKVYIRIYSRRYRQMRKEHLRAYHRNYGHKPEVRAKKHQRYRAHHPKPDKYPDHS